MRLPALIGVALVGCAFPFCSLVGAAEPKNILTTNLLNLPFGILNAEYERVIGPTTGIYCSIRYGGGTLGFSHAVLSDQGVGVSVGIRRYRATAPWGGHTGLLLWWLRDAERPRLLWREGDDTWALMFEVGGRKRWGSISYSFQLGPAWQIRTQHLTIIPGLGVNLGYAW